MSASPITLFLADADPVFRMGLRIWLSQRPEFLVLGEASTSQDTLAQLAELHRVAIASATDAGSTAAQPPVQVVVLDLSLGQDAPEQLPGLSLCGAIKQQFPELAVLVLAATDAPVLREAARHLGADGFGLRTLPTRELARLIQRVAIAPSPLAPLPEAASELSYPPPTEGPLAYLRRTALAEIDNAIAEIEQAAQQRLPYWYQLVLAGKYRELRMARRVVERLYRQGSSPRQSSPSVEAAARSPDASLVADPATSLPLTTLDVPLSLPVSSTRGNSGALTPLNVPSPVVSAAVRSRVCEAVFRKLQFPLDNQSNIPLEIDILRTEKARELLYTVLKTFETLLDDLQAAQIPPGQLPEKTPTFLYDLWEAVTLDFFGRYYTPPVDGLDQPMVTFLQQDGAIVQSAILDSIPQVPTLLSHLLYQTPLDIDGATFVATAPEALRRSQYLLENLVIAVGCGVMQPVLNRYADEESIKRSLYHRRMMSSRDITRFRNELSWRYRWDALINEPKAIFESEYRLFVLTPDGIRAHRIYAPRQAELDSLSGLQYVVTLAIEARDAIAPRLRSALSLVGSGLIFVLTEVIGRGIGLIGRGVAKGVGNTWQDIRYRQR